MFGKVIVGVDEQQGGRDALLLAERLTGEDGELTLAHVYAGDAHAWRGSNAAYDVAERERSLKLLTRVRDEAGVQARLACLGSPTAGRGLHELADARGCDLLVVGSSRRSLIGRVLLGDDTRRSLNGAPCAVAIAPSGYGQHPAAMREIGVGYDGSAESRHAFDVAAELAAQLGLKLSAFHALPLPSYARLPKLEIPFDKDVTEARERIAALGDVEPHAAYGLPSEELALYSASIDVLVVGSRGYGPIGRLVHGSVSGRLAGRARCPLLVLPRGVPSPARPGTAEQAELAEA